MSITNIVFTPSVQYQQLQGHTQTRLAIPIAVVLVDIGSQFLGRSQTAWHSLKMLTSKRLHVRATSWESVHIARMKNNNYCTVHSVPFYRIISVDGLKGGYQTSTHQYGVR